MHLEYGVARRQVQHYLVVSRLMRFVFFGCVFYIMYTLMGSIDDRTNTAARDYKIESRNVIVKPVVQINSVGIGIVSIIGREATVINDDVMSFNEIEIVSTALAGKAKKGYVNSKTNEIIMLDRPKFKIHRF
jgi:hypothetical protein